MILDIVAVASFLLAVGLYAWTFVRARRQNMLAAQMRRVMEFQTGRRSYNDPISAMERLHSTGAKRVGTIHGDGNAPSREREPAPKGDCGCSLPQ